MKKYKKRKIGRKDPQKKESSNEMKYLRQMTIILFFSFMGEFLNEFLPLPVPAGIYGLLIMLLSLMSGVLKVSDIKETAMLLIEIMPVMFVPAAVGIMDVTEELSGILLPLVVIIPVTTVAGIGITGLITQTIIRKSCNNRKLK